MNTQNKSLEYKIDLWKNLSDDLNKKKNNIDRVSNAFAIIAIIISAINAINYNADETIIKEILDVFIISLPLLILIFLFWFSLNFRVIAITQGYLAGLEDKINEQLEGRLYQLHSYYHWLYSRKYFPSNNFLFFFYCLIIGILSTISFYNMFEQKLISVFSEICYIIIYISFVVMLFFELNTNVKMRKIARAYFHSNVNNLQIDKMNLKEFLIYEPDIDKIVEQFEINNN